jgi:hypothetical protein
MNEVKPTSRLKCPLVYESTGIFFSLVDYRNSRFTSENPDKIIEFYESFKNRDNLIEWMKERPKGVANVYEVDGDKEIIVVIPTASFNGKYARDCRENIFKGLHMIFVESGGKGDFYFNIAHNYNTGIKRALDYNPKWIVISNDDMYRIDDVNILARELSNIDQVKTKAVFTEPSKYHSYQVRVGKKRRILFSLASFLDEWRHFRDKNFVIENNIKKKFRINWTRGPDNFLVSRILLKNVKIFLLSGDFLILSSSFVRQLDGMIFDESYINGWEDLDLSLQISIEDGGHSIIDFRIGDLIGSTLSPTKEENRNRLLRDVANKVYLDYKISKGLISRE